MNSVKNLRLNADNRRLCGVVSLFLLSCIPSTPLSAQVTGTVFRDFNGDGVRQTNEPLIPGVTVNVYNTANVICGTAVSAGNTAPNYSAPGCGTGPVRVEFLLPNVPGVCLSPGLDFLSFSNGTAQSNVRFVNGNSTNVNFGIIHPDDYNTGTTGVDVYVPCYIGGDPLPSGSAVGGRDWFVGFPYTNTGTTAPNRKLDGRIIGSTWGVAYSKQAGVIFTSAFLKRHVGLGTLGSGGIYKLTPTVSSFTVNAFYDMDANGHRTRAAATAVAYGAGSSFTINGTGTVATFIGPVDPLTGKPEGLGVIGSNAQRDLATTLATPSYDPAAFDQTGKVGLGDIEISDDGRFLFVMNLYSRRLFRLELNDPANPTAVVDVQSYPVPTVNCNNGELRPFAVKFERDKVYVGAVCSGENGGQNIINGATDLYAYVFQMDNPTTGTAAFQATPIISYPLNFQRGAAYTAVPNSNRWFPWSNNVTDAPAGFGARPSPILSNIDFTDRGDLVMVFLDRAGNQYGYNNRRFLSNVNPTFQTNIAVGGDVLIAGVNCNGTYTLESNGTITSINGGTVTGNGVGNNQGPGGGEFFAGENFGGIHFETSQGAVAVVKGQGEFIITVMDPTEILSGGTRRFSTSNGSFGTTSYRLYTSADAGTFGKAIGLGDMELSGTTASIEIGNRVWNDLNGNGIQDADEPGLAGVNVTLWLDDGMGNFTAIAGVTTDVNGQYLFTSAPGASTNGITRNVTQLLPNRSYELRFPATVGALTPTTPNNGGLDANADARDSDANAGGVIAFVTGGPGANNHSFDVGYSCPPSPCLPTTVVKN